MSSTLVSAPTAQVVFLADKTTDDIFELYRVQTAGAPLALDIDGDDRVLALTDMLLLKHWHLGLRGTALIPGALGANAIRTSAPQIEAYIQALLMIAAPL